MTAGAGTPPTPPPPPPNPDDVVVTVTLPMGEYRRLRAMIERDEEQEAILKWVKWVVFACLATVGSTITGAILLWDQIRGFFSKFGG